MYKKEVRTRMGAPTPGDFASWEGAPIVIDQATGAASTLKEPGDVITEIGARAGWVDLLGPISQGKIAGANVPNWAVFRGGISAYSFSATAMNEVWLAFHVPHDYLPASMLYPHVHWSTTGTNTGVVRWGVEYTSARGYGIEAFPAPTTVYIEQAGSGVAYQHMIAEPAEGLGIVIPNLEPDSLILIRLFRDGAAGSDTQTDPAFGLFMDLHYQSDGMLTNERNRTFTKKRGNF